MEAFVNVVRKNPKVRVKINDSLDRYMRLPYIYIYISIKNRL